MLGTDLATASVMASGAPASFLGLDQETGRIAPGLSADMVLLDDDLRVLETWIAGESDSALRSGREAAIDG
jgi:N-acetylglucosamine-6-phosphate deacetylase